MTGSHFPDFLVLCILFTSASWLFGAKSHGNSRRLSRPANGIFALYTHNDIISSQWLVSSMSRGNCSSQTTQILKHSKQCQGRTTMTSDISSVKIADREIERYRMLPKQAMGSNPIDLFEQHAASFMQTLSLCRCSGVFSGLWAGVYYGRCYGWTSERSCLREEAVDSLIFLKKKYWRTAWKNVTNRVERVESWLSWEMNNKI